MIASAESAKGFFSRFIRKEVQIKSKEIRESRFAPIVDVTKAAEKIWFDNRGKKHERRAQAAQILLERLTPEIISDPRFYQEVDADTHLHALGLLFERRIPRVGEKFDEFMQSNDQRTIELYLKGFVDNAANMVNLRIREDDPKAKNKIVSILRINTDIPAHYAEIICPKVGLPLPAKANAI